MSVKTKKTILIFIIAGILATSAFAYFFIFQKPETATAETSATFYSSTSDGSVYKSQSAAYATVHDATTGSIFGPIIIGQDYGGSSRIIYRGFVFFDTSSIPSNATITSATLSLYGWEDDSTRDFIITIQNGQPTYPHDPLVAGDYYYVNYSGDGGTFNTSGFSVSGYNDIVLNADGLSWIQKGDGAVTKLALLSSRDISALAPTGREYVIVKSSEDGAGLQPKLVVDYTLPANNSTKVSSGIKIGNGINFK
jgi:hypothetical protein